MTRLDVALVNRKLISSRTRAQRAIRLGFVIVNGQAVNKPSFQVTPNDMLIVDVIADKPRGFWKLQQIQNACTVSEAGDIVLDIGASAGGFMLYALQQAGRVYALEFSASLIYGLNQIAHQYPGTVIILHADSFTYDFGRFAGYFDVILNDVTAEPEASLRLLARCAIALKAGGRVLQVFKGKMSEAAVNSFKESIEDTGFKILCSLTSQRNELFIIAEKLASKSAEEGI